MLNVVHGFGPDSAGSALTQHRGVDRITFTGESGTGRAIGQAAAANLTPVSFELGGKGANLVFDDADLDNAVAWSIKAIFANAGQVCLAGSRLFVQRGIYDEFLARFVAAAEALTHGRPEGPGHRSSARWPRRSTGRRSPATSTTSRPGTGRMLTGGPADGWFVRPTVVVDAPLDSRVVCEEVFGPLVTVHPFDTEEEAVAARQRLAVRPQRDGLHREPVPRAPGLGRAEGRDGLGELLLHPRPAGAVRRRRRLGRRPRGRHLQPGVLHRAQGRGDADLVVCLSIHLPVATPCIPPGCVVVTRRRTHYSVAPPPCQPGAGRRADRQAN